MLPAIRFCLFIFILFVFDSKWHCDAANQEVDLQSYLNGLTYSIYARPLTSPSGSTRIRMTYFLEHVLEVDASSQTITLSGLLFIYWNDAVMRWTPSSYGNVTSTRRGVSKVWTPQFSITNSAGSVQRVVPDTESDQVTLDYLGNVYYEIKLLTTTSCSMDVKNFPYDSQYCTLEFNIEGYTKSQIEIVTEKNYDSKNFYLDSREWSLSSWGNFVGSFSLTISVVNNVTLNIPQYTYWVTITRQAAYYNFLIIYPMVMLSVLLLLVFYLPIESGEKIGLGVTVMLAFVVFLLLLDSLIPKTDNLPYVSNYVSSQIILSTITIYISSFILRIYNMDPQIRMPDALYNFVIIFIGTSVGYFGLCRRAPSRKNVEQQPLQFELNADKKEKKENQNVVQVQKEEWETMAKILDNFFMIVGVLVVFFVSIFLLSILPNNYVNQYNSTQISSQTSSNS